MTITIDGDALKLLEDFIKYGQLDPEASAKAMQYDENDFKKSLVDLERALADAKKPNTDIGEIMTVLKNGMRPFDPYGRRRNQWRRK